MKTTINKLTITVIFLLIMLDSSCSINEQFPDDDIIDSTQYEYLENWKKGYLDIHQISTGRGNCTFMILPDGTTMLVDAGDLGDASVITQEIMPAVPNLSKRPAEWIATYVQNFIQPAEKDWIDYAFITHFDTDHIGKVDRLSVNHPERPYKLTGISYLNELIDIKKIVDRGWPDYSYPSQRNFTPTHVDNYLKFMRYRSNEQNKTNELFLAGVNNQFKLLYDPNSFPEFEIRNIYANGMIWTGEGNGTRELFPPIHTLSASQHPNENRCSSTIKLNYGKFDYHSAGDIIGFMTANQAAWYDMETPIGEVIGETDVVLANHHAYSDAMNENFIKSTTAQVFIIPVWDYYHPQPDPLNRMLSTKLYSGEREVYAAGLVQNNAVRLGDIAKQIKPDGHIVTRVFPGGDTFQIIVLNNKSTKYEVIYKSKIFNSK